MVDVVEASLVVCKRKAAGKRCIVELGTTTDVIDMFAHRNYCIEMAQELDSLHGYVAHVTREGGEIDENASLGKYLKGELLGLRKELHDELEGVINPPVSSVVAEDVSSEAEPSAPLPQADETSLRPRQFRLLAGIFPADSGSTVGPALPTAIRSAAGEEQLPLHSPSSSHASTEASAKEAIGDQAAAAAQHARKMDTDARVAELAAQEAREIRASQLEPPASPLALAEDDDANAAEAAAQEARAARASKLSGEEARGENEPLAKKMQEVQKIVQKMADFAFASTTESSDDANDHSDDDEVVEFEEEEEGDDTAANDGRDDASDSVVGGEHPGLRASKDGGASSGGSSVIEDFEEFHDDVEEGAGEELLVPLPGDESDGAGLSAASLVHDPSEAESVVDDFGSEDAASEEIVPRNVLSMTSDISARSQLPVDSSTSSIGSVQEVSGDFSSGMGSDFAGGHGETGLTLAAESAARGGMMAEPLGMKGGKPHDGLVYGVDGVVYRDATGAESLLPTKERGEENALVELGTTPTKEGNVEDDDDDDGDDDGDIGDMVGETVSPKEDMRADGREKPGPDFEALRKNSNLMGWLQEGGGAENPYGDSEEELDASPENLFDRDVEVKTVHASFGGSEKKPGELAPRVEKALKDQMGAYVSERREEDDAGSVGGASGGDVAGTQATGGPHWHTDEPHWQFTNEELIPEPAPAPLAGGGLGDRRSKHADFLFGSSGSGA